MAAKENGVWDFNSYDQNTWFRFLIFKFSGLLCLYILWHLLCCESQSSYEYNRLNDEQKLFVGRLYAGEELTDTLKKFRTSVAAKANVGPRPVTRSGQTTQKATQDTTKAPKNTSKQAMTTQSEVIGEAVGPMMKSGSVELSEKAESYLDNVFEGKLDEGQLSQIKDFLVKSKPQDAVAFLSATRYRVKSYFWLIGPSVYGEVYFWSLFGVLASLFFALGTVNSNNTSDLGNPKSIFDGSEIYGQIAKICYAPLCTLCVVFGYNYFKDQNIVDISSSKGVLAFAFIAGFYSSRIIALMDRLKEVLFPNSGSTSLPATVSAVARPLSIVTVQLKLDPELPKETQGLLNDADLNQAVVQLKVLNAATEYSATRKETDPLATFTAAAVLPGRYMISAHLKKTLPDSSVLHLASTLEGQLLSGGAPVILTLKKMP